MASHRRARATTGRRAAALVAVLVAVAGVLGYDLPALSSSTSGLAPRLPDLRGEHRGALGEDDGAVPESTTVFDDAVPGIARLDPALLRALHGAARAAAGAGITFHVDSGWRSPAYQRRLRREAVARYGSEAEAARWVASPETSAHVSGDAVDLGPAEATAWLAEHGAGYGLCQTYDNEPWHYELRPDALDRGCPPRYPDPTHDPRMHR